MVPLKITVKIVAIFAIFDDFSKFCSTFGTVHLKKSSNTAKSLKKMKKKHLLGNYSITYMATFGTKNIHSAVSLTALPQISTEIQIIFSNLQSDIYCVYTLHTYCI